jgi:hypothetical protein
MNKVDEKAMNELQQNIDKFVDKMTSDDFKVDKEQSVKFSKFFESFSDIISKNENLLPEKAKKVFNNIFLNLDKIQNKKISDNTIEELKTYLKKHDYESIGDYLLEKDSSVGGKRNKSKRNKSKRNKSKKNKSKRNKSKRNKSRRNKSRRKINSKYSKLKGGMVNADEDANMCPICYEELSDNTRGQPVIFHVPPNGIPHRSHFNCVKDWVINRINQNAVITCPQCNQTLNFNELPIELQEDADIQQAYAAQYPQQPQVVQNALVALGVQNPRVLNFINNLPLVFWLFNAIFFIIMAAKINDVLVNPENYPPEHVEQIHEFLRQLNNIFTDLFNNMPR